MERCLSMMTNVGEVSVENTLPLKLTFEGLDIGKDTKYPVSPEYEHEGEFEFDGKLVKVDYFLGDDEKYFTPSK